MSRPSRRAASRALAATALTALAATLGGVAASAPAGAQSPAPARPPLGALLTTCSTGPDAADRTAVFTGAMPQIRRASSMGMRFELQARPFGSGDYTRVKVPGFATLVRSEPGAAGFVYAKRVEELAPAAAYRVVVQFRWFDDRGLVVRRAQRTSAVCRQPDLRPDLRVAKVLVGAPRPDGLAPYLVTVRNVGETAAPAFTTALSAGGMAGPLLGVGGLGPGASATLTFRAPRCAPGSPVVATVDAGGAVDEADETDDVARLACPAA